MSQSSARCGEAAGAPAHQIKVLARGLKILKCFAPENAWLSNQEIAERTEIPKPTVSRLTSIFLGQGVLEADEVGGGYRLSAAVFAIGGPLSGASSMWRDARVLLDRFVEKNGGVAVIAERDGLSMLCLEVCQNSSGLISLNIEDGSRLALHRSAVGRAWYAAASPEERGGVNLELEARYAATPERAAEIRKELGAVSVNKEGVYIGVGNLEQGVNGLGAPLMVDGRFSGFALGVAGPSGLYTKAALGAQLMDDLLDLKSALERSAVLASGI